MKRKKGDKINASVFGAKYVTMLEKYEHWKKYTFVWDNIILHGINNSSRTFCTFYFHKSQVYSQITTTFL